METALHRGASWVGAGGEVMRELPQLTPDRFEILVVRELRKAGLEVSELRIHRRSSLQEPEHGYLLELLGVVTQGPGRRRVLIACRQQQVPIGRAEIASLKTHLAEAALEGGILFGAADFEEEAVTAAEGAPLVLLRVTDGRTAFDTSGWGAPGHYPAWLPVYCAQAMARGPAGELRYDLLDAGYGERLWRQLETDTGRLGPAGRD